MRIGDEDALRIARMRTAMDEITDDERQAIQKRLGNPRTLKAVHKDYVLNLLMDREAKVKKIRELLQWCPSCHGTRGVRTWEPNGEREGGWVKFGWTSRECETCKPYWVELERKGP